MDVPPKAESQAAHIWESALEQSEGKMIQTIHTSKNFFLQLYFLDIHQQYNQSNYYRYLLQDVMERYLEGDGVTNAKNCLNENLVYGSLSAYRLFYVGCSRARKNLTIIIDRTNIAEFEEKLVEKLKWCGFKVVKK